MKKLRILSLALLLTFAFSQKGPVIIEPLGNTPIFKSYTYASRPGAFGESFSAGFYIYDAAEVVLTIGGTVTKVFGAADVPYAAHAFIVAEGAGGTDLVLTVSGTSITDAGIRDDSGEEIIVADADEATTDEYFETSKKWIGPITYTLTGAADAFTFNYGFCKYEDFGNRSFVLTDYEAVGLANAADTDFEIEVLHHKATGWTFSAAAFQAGTTPLYSMNTIHSTEQDLDAGVPFAFKRAGLNVSINGASREGILIRITTGSNIAVSYMDSHIGVQF